VNSDILEPLPARAIASLLPLVFLLGCQTAGIRPDNDLNTANIGCKFGFSKCVPVVIPPRVAEAGVSSTVAIVSSNTPGSKAIGLQFEALLSKVRVDDHPYYNIVAPSDSKRQLTYDITATAWNVADSHVIETRSQCNDAQTGGSLIKRCKSSSQVNVSCSVRAATVGANVRVRAQNGTLLATRQEGSVAESKQCQGDNSGALLDSAALLGQAADKVASALQEAVAVRIEVVPVRAMDDPSEIRDGARQERFREATVFLKAGRLDRACPVYQELIELDRTSVAVLHNAGFCAQARGNWCKANGLYRQADALTRTPNSDLAALINETQPSCAVKR
jgi:hypothetical protein